LDILGGTYDNSSKTIIASGDPFTLFAYLIPDCKAPLTDTYFISAAVFPRTGPALQDLGSFVFDGMTVAVTEDMVYGNPPLESYATQLKEHGDLTSHGIFPSYFMQFAFTFDPEDRASAYNTAQTPGVGPTLNSSGRMYFHSFDVDTRSLESNYFIHFDLYNTKNIPITDLVCTNRCTRNGRNRTCNEFLLGYDIDIKSFAPFSHDAQSTHRVPESGTLVLLGIGLLALGLLGKKRSREQ
jgi:hypothetical protein